MYCSLRRRGHGRIVAGFTTIYAINDYHHQSCEFESTQSWRGVLDTTFCDKVCQLLAAECWFSLGTPVASTNETDCHAIGTGTTKEIRDNTIVEFVFFIFKLYR